jgi:predicted naringenin-chalcone synthase
MRVGMSAPAILALATGVPEARYSQNDIAEYFIALQSKETRRARAMRAIFARAGVGFRHMMVGEEFYKQPRSTQERNDLYMPEAVALGERTIRRGLEAAGVSVDEIDDFIVISCTGITVPGLDLNLAARMGMRHDLQRTCILGMGCYAAFPGLLRAGQSVIAQPGRLALVLALELCSLHMQMEDSAENVVSSALFSDGAAMALVGDEKHNTQNACAPRLLRSATFSDYGTLDHMTFNLTDQGFRMYLSSYVPDLLAAQIEAFVDGLLAKANLDYHDVRFWGIHPGSTKIVDYVQSKLRLTDAQVEFSHQVLHEYGNMSSPTILFVLDRIQQCGQPSPGDYGVLLAFGPGLTMEGLLVQW